MTTVKATEMGNRGPEYPYSIITGSVAMLKNERKIGTGKRFTKPWRESPRLQVVGMNRQKVYLKVWYINSCW